MDENTFVFLRLNDGKEVPVATCTCGECSNEFYVPALSDEWTPNYCPFCGIKFVRRTMNGVPQPYIPG